VDAQCDKLATVELSWQHFRRSHAVAKKKQEMAKFRVWDKVRDGITVIHEFQYKAAKYDKTSEK